jgi:hypothetical protein
MYGVRRLRSASYGEGTIDPTSSQYRSTRVNQAFSGTLMYGK